MSAPATSSPHCRVIDGDKLPAASGGSAALCAAIERAVSERSPGTAFTAEVRVLPRSMLAATVTVEGRKLSEQKFASMDRELEGASFARFAAALAEAVAGARR